ISSGGRIRVLVMDPTDDALAAAAEASYPNIAARRLQNRILTTLDDLAMIKEESKSGRLEVRVLPWPPKVGINALDLGKPTGVVYVQHYEHKPTGEAAPIFRLEATDGPWYNHFAAEALRLWEDGCPWPLTAEQRLSRTRRPIFMESFSSEIKATIEDADDLLITGVTRNTLINSNYGKLEKLLLAGCRVRFLIVDPDSDAIAIAADRYYAERSASSARERVRHALRMLTELQRATCGNLSVRLTSHPIAIGLIAVNSTAELRTTSSALLIEYYTYRSAGEPKLVLQPADEVWFQHFVEEAEALWASAKPYTLMSSAEGGDVVTDSSSAESQ
ncbi:MAG: hypothetical protein ACRDSF_12200, partial [Pseudonocardiaceae bacterium]